MAGLTAEQEQIKARFMRERGYWRPWAEKMLHADPQFLARYADYAGYPARSGPLSARMVELIYVALDSSSTHLYEPGLRTHLTKAREAGASLADVLDVLHLVACQGVGAVFAGAAILAQEAGLASSGEDRAGADWPARGAMEALEPGYLRCTQDFLEHKAPGDGLSPGERCLVEVALHASFTGFDGDALRRSLRAALSEGRATAELLQAMQLGAHLSLHGTALGVSLLDEARFSSR